MDADAYAWMSCADKSSGRTTSRLCITECCKFPKRRRIKHDIPSKLYLQTPPQRPERYHIIYILPSYIFLDPSYQSKIPQQTLQHQTVHPPRDPTGPTPDPK